MESEAGRRSPATAPRVELDEEGLIRWGRRLGERALAERAFVCLYGALGAGKSTLARAACRGAGVTGAVPSPTFTLVNRYLTVAGVPVYHADLHRLESPEQLWDIGWPDLLDGEGPVFVEWAERAADRLPPDRWVIELDFAADPRRRGVRARSVGGTAPVPRPEEAC